MVFSDPARVRAGARAKRKREVSAKMQRWLERLDAEGFQDPVPPTVDEAVRVTGGTDGDRLMWMKICNRGLNTFLGMLMDFEYDLEKHTNHPLRNPAAAFQARQNDREKRHHPRAQERVRCSSQLGG